MQMTVVLTIQTVQGHTSTATILTDIKLEMTVELDPVIKDTKTSTRKFICRTPIFLWYRFLLAGSHFSLNNSKKQWNFSVEILLQICGITRKQPKKYGICSAFVEILCISDEVPALYESEWVYCDVFVSRPHKTQSKTGDDNTLYCTDYSTIHMSTKEVAYARVSPSICRQVI